MVDNQAFTKRRMSSDLIINAPPFFCLFSKGKKITKPQGVTSLCEAQLHSKGVAFSSHLHSNRRFALLVKRSACAAREAAPFLLCQGYGGQVGSKDVQIL